MQAGRVLSTFAAAAAVIALALRFGVPVRAENTAPAIAAFDQAFAAINDYQCDAARARGQGDGHAGPRLPTLVHEAAFRQRR